MWYNKVSKEKENKKMENKKFTIGKLSLENVALILKIDVAKLTFLSIDQLNELVIAEGAYKSSKLHYEALLNKYGLS
jgi:hypothetical protein